MRIRPLLLMLLLTACSPAEQRLHSFFEAEWERGLADNPIQASFLGDARYNDRWPDESPAAIAARQEKAVAALRQLEQIPRARLSAEDQLSYDLFQRDARLLVEGFRFREYLMPVTALDGPQLLSQLTEVLPFATRKDYEDWCARLEALPAYFAQIEALMREGLREGRVMPKVGMQRVVPQLAAQLVARPEDSPYYAPFKRLPVTLGEAERAALSARGRAAVEQHVLPAYRRLQAFFLGDYLPASRDSVAALTLPDGAEYYAWRARRMTTTDWSPQRIHDTGLSEVARLRGEMQRVITQTGFKGDFAAFLAFLRSDPRFYLRDEAALLDRYRAIAKRLDGELPKLFGRMPRLPYGVRGLPPEMAPSSPAAYYYPGASDGRRAGFFYANTYKPETRPLWEMEALTAHEAVPGHHFQIALAQELDHLPRFRREGGITAFIEGWGLYAESLGGEMGLYTDPYSKFGQLTYEMWRAIRLVVDTGIHAKGWTREQAVQYFLDNAGKSRHDIEVEVDRYIVWPGQALAYKIGELKIKELRALAERELGPRFDVRAFHDTVLGSGPLPLDLLEQNVRAFLDRSKSEAQRGG